MLRGLAAALRASGVTITFGIKEGRKRARLMLIKRATPPTPTGEGARPSASSAPPAFVTAQDSDMGHMADDACPDDTDAAPAADGQADDPSGEADDADGCTAGVSGRVSSGLFDEWGEV